MKRFLVSPIAVLSVFALSVQSSDCRADSGREYAAQVCEKMSFSGDRETCNDIVRGAQFFFLAAVDICGRLAFAEHRVTCIEVIANKIYDDFEIRICARKLFTDELLQCMADGGRPYANGLGATTPR